MYLLLTPPPTPIKTLSLPLALTVCLWLCVSLSLCALISSVSFLSFSPAFPSRYFHLVFLCVVGESVVVFSPAQLVAGRIWCLIRYYVGEYLGGDGGQGGGGGDRRWGMHSVTLQIMIHWMIKTSDTTKQRERKKVKTTSERNGLSESKTCWHCIFR